MNRHLPKLVSSWRQIGQAGCMVFEVEFQSLREVGYSSLFGVSLAGHLNIKATSDESTIFFEHSIF
jgi:hypothetical protein